MIKDFDFDDRDRETYILAWPLQRSWGCTYKSGQYKRPLNATIGRKAYRTYEKNKFLGTIGDGSLAHSLDIIPSDHPLHGTAMEVPDPNDLVLMRLMNPEDYIHNEIVDWNDEESVKKVLPRIYHITPKLLKLSHRYLKAKYNVDKYREEVIKYDWEIKKIIREMKRFTTNEQTITFNSPTVDKAIDAMKIAGPELSALSREMNRRNNRAHDRNNWLRSKLKDLWEVEAKYGANDFDS